MPRKKEKQIGQGQKEEAKQVAKRKNQTQGRKNIRVN
jgi:hypothetical protein